MKNSDQDPLLDEVFAGGEHLEALRRATLQAGLASLRQKRFRRRVGKALLMLPPLGAAFLLWYPRTQPTSITSNPPVVGPASPAPMHPPAPTAISERELFALFPNRPMALVGKTGHQRVVFLDEPPVSD